MELKEIKIEIGQIYSQLALAKQKEREFQDNLQEASKRVREFQQHLTFLQTKQFELEGRIQKAGKKKPIEASGGSLAAAILSALSPVEIAQLKAQLKEELSL